MALSHLWGGILHTKLKSWAKIAGFMVLGFIPAAAFGQAFNPITAFSPVAGSVIRQTNANSFAGKATLAAGLVTVTFQVPYTSIPSCQLTEETAAGRFPQISAISATAFSVTSSVTASNTDIVDWTCVGNPS